MDYMVFEDVSPIFENDMDTTVIVVYWGVSLCR